MKPLESALFLGGLWAPGVSPLAIDTRPSGAENCLPGVHDIDQEEGMAQTMSGLFKTYQEVAREISEGMASGTVSLGWDETREDLASVAFVLFRFLSPTRLAITAAAAAEAPLMGPHTSLDAEISPEEYEWLPDEVKAEFEGKVKELRAKGIKVRIMPTHT